MSSLLKALRRVEKEREEHRAAEVGQYPAASPGLLPTPPGTAADGQGTHPQAAEAPQWWFFRFSPAHYAFSIVLMLLGFVAGSSWMPRSALSSLPASPPSAVTTSAATSVADDGLASHLVETKQLNVRLKSRIETLTIERTKLAHEMATLSAERDASAEARQEIITAGKRREQELVTRVAALEGGASTANRAAVVREQKLSSELAALGKELDAMRAARVAAVDDAEMKVVEWSSKLAAVEKELSTTRTARDTIMKAGEAQVATLSSKLATVEKELSATRTARDTTMKAGKAQVATLSSKLVAVEKELTATLAARNSTIKVGETQAAALLAKLADMEKHLTAMRAARDMAVAVARTKAVVQSATLASTAESALLNQEPLRLRLDQELQIQTE